MLFITGCKKEAKAPLPLNTIVADIDGKTETFNRNLTRYITDTVGNHVIGFSAYTNDSDYVLLSFGGSSTVSRTTYKLFDGTNANSAYVFFERFHNVDPYRGYEAYSGISYGDKPVIITITNINGFNVEGTFTGDFMGERKLSIRNGRFNIALQ